MPSGRSFPSGLGIYTRRTGLRSIRLLPQFFRQFVQPLSSPVRLDVFERLSVDARQAAVVAARRLGGPQHVRSIHLVVQRIEPLGWATPSLSRAVSACSFSTLGRVVVGSSPISRCCCWETLVLKLRSLPSTGVTRLQRYYGPLRHLVQPGRSLAGFRLKVTRLHREASRVAFGSPCRMPSPLPRRNPGMRVIARFSQDGGLPRFDVGSASAFAVSRPQWRSLAFRPADSQSCQGEPFASKAFADLSPPPRLRLLLAGATFARRDSIPAENQTPFHGALQRSSCSPVVQANASALACIFRYFPRHSLSPKRTAACGHRQTGPLVLNVS